VIDIAKRIRERINEEARKRNSERAVKRNPSPWPVGLILFGAVAAAVVIAAVWLFG
jgi:hypothetical protein